MLDAADIQVDAAGVVRPRRILAHPVPLDIRVAEGLVVRRIQVAQFVPAGTGPLRHDVQFAAVDLRAVAQVQFDGRPLRRAGQRGHRRRWWRRRGRRSSASSRRPPAAPAAGTRRAGRSRHRPRHRRSGTAHPNTAGGRTASPATCTGRAAGRNPCRSARRSWSPWRPRRPSRPARPRNCCELIAGPSPVKALSSSWSAVGCTVRMIGSPKALAKSQSRVSCPGTAMIAPVP